MKNFLILGLTALLLFSISAALSLWLNQGKYASETSPSTEKAAKKSNADKEEPVPHRTEGKESGLGGVDPDSLAKTMQREKKLDMRTEQVDIILKDLVAQRDIIDSLIRQVTSELKNADSKLSDLEVRASELEKKKIDYDLAERKNIERIASLLDAMSPESSAATLKQMADSGKLEVAAKVLTLMKDRNAARTLGELSDPALAAQLLDKMRLLKAATAPPTPRPSGTLPAGGIPPNSPIP